MQNHGTDTDTDTDFPDDPGSDKWIPVWDGAAYAANTSHHRVNDAWFLRSFPIRSTDRVLDLGCGSGDFSRVVADMVPDGQVVCLDAQPSMLDEARRRAGHNQSFIEGPVQALATLLPSPDHDATFDAVMSRSVLHWVPQADHPGLLANAGRLMRRGAWLRIECGGGGNVVSVVRGLDAISAEFGGPSAPWNFMDAGTYLELVEQAGFVLGEDGYIHTVAQRREFDRESFLGWMRSQAVEAYASGVPEQRREAFRQAVEDRIDDFKRHDGTFDQTYVRLDLLVRKP